MNTTLNWHEVASTTGTLIGSSYGFWELYTGIFVATVAIGGMIWVVITSFKRNIRH